MLATRMTFAIALGMLAAVLPASAQASNGFYLPGYGMESAMMAGADVAVARDAFAANNNPAGMTQINGQAGDLEGVIYYFPENSFTSSFGDHHKNITNGLGGYANGAYAQRSENSPFAAGMALVVQGGMGWVYRGLNSALGRDDAGSTFAILKLAPAVAWEVNDSLSLGAALGINYIGANQELFPNTSAPGFPGFRFKGAGGFGLNSKWGLQYRPAKDVVIGLTYGTQTSVPMKDGTLRINYSDPSFGSLGVVRYDNARLNGFRLPEEMALGVSFRPAPAWLISVQEKWYNWSEALKTLQLSASKSGAPPVNISTPLYWNDQHVLEIGFAYDYGPDTVVMGGINHARRPMPDRNLNPIFAPIQTRHYMLGVSRKLDAEWHASGGLEWVPLQEAQYSDALFGNNAKVRMETLLIHFGVSRRW